MGIGGSLLKDHLVSIIIIMKQRSNAFTIVELLIVIVVIGILAAISIVAYNNIQQNARNSATSQAVSQWVRILNMHKADRGNFPTVASS